MNVLQLHFVDRAKWISFEVNDETFGRLRQGFTEHSRQSKGFWEFATRQEQHVWVNMDRISMIRYLYEPKTFTPLPKSDSRHYSEEGAEVFDEITWNVRLWMAGKVDSLELDHLDGHAWTTLSTGADFPRSHVTFTDEDGEDITLSVPHIDVFCGYERNRFSGDYHDVLAAEIDEEKAKPSDAANAG